MTRRINRSVLVSSCSIQRPASSKRIWIRSTSEDAHLTFCSRSYDNPTRSLRNANSSSQVAERQRR